MVVVVVVDDVLPAGAGIAGALASAGAVVVVVVEDASGMAGAAGAAAGAASVVVVLLVSFSQPARAVAASAIAASAAMGVFRDMISSPVIRSPCQRSCGDVGSALAVQAWGQPIHAPCSALWWIWQ
jgi:7-keto-8-aminopelargonate synthetase-like enzyme